jgi:hypothetical protein
MPIYYRNPAICRVYFVGHLTKLSLPSVILDEIRLSVTSWYTESETLGIEF